MVKRQGTLQVQRGFHPAYEGQVKLHSKVDRPIENKKGQEEGEDIAYTLDTTLHTCRRYSVACLRKQFRTTEVTEKRDDLKREVG